MARLCELCGAKLRPDDQTCHECGLAVGPRAGSAAARAAKLRAASVASAPPPPPDFAADAPAEIPPPAVDVSPPVAVAPPVADVVVAAAAPPSSPVVAAPMPAPTATSEMLDVPRRSKLPLVLGGLLVTAAAIGAVAWTQTRDDPPTASPVQEAEVASTPNALPASPAVGPAPVADPADPCADLAKLAGAWTFHTEVVGARVLSSSGLNGFYTLEVTPADACAATAVVTKTGFTARRYGQADLQRAEAKIAKMDGPLGFGFGAVFPMRDESDEGVDLEIVFTPHGDALSGIYRQRGERWERTGLAGFLHGVRGEGAPEALDVAAQPCTVRCAVACDVSHRETIEVAAMSTCVSGCDAAPEATPVCGDAAPLPDGLGLAMQGPDSIEALCAGIGGCRKKLEVGKDRAPVLGAKRFSGELQGARYVRPKGKGPVRLAVRTEAGWYLSGPVLDVGSGALQEAHLYARHLSEANGRRYLMGLVGAGASDEVFVACRPGDGAPRCVRVPKSRTAYVSLLPGDALVITGSGEHPDGQPSAGVYRW